MRRRYFPTLVVMLSSLLVTACAMGPDYERPQTDMPEEFGQVVDSGASIANLKWWELFGDEQLNSLIGIALEQNIMLLSEDVVLVP